MTIEKEKSEKSPWIAKGMNEKSVFPVLRMEIRSPYHNVDLIFKSVCFIAITEPSADADIFEELHFEFQSVEYQYAQVENASITAHSSAEMKARS